jgi:uncharacterized protein with GYD domain
MPMYLIQGRYPRESWQALIAKPEDREAVLRKSIAEFGGKLHSFHFAFGESDTYAIIEAPDNKTMMAGALAAATAGVSTKTTVLITSAEAKKALEQAKQAQAVYAAPGKGKKPNKK